MVEHRNNLPADGEDEESGGGGLDVGLIRDFVGFALRATRRRAIVAAATFATIAALGLLVSTALPPTYTAEVKLFAQRGSAIRVLSSPNPALDAVDSPTKNVATTILRHDNLVALAKEADLVRRSQKNRPRLLKWRDALITRFAGAATEDDKIEGMAFTLEKLLSVEVSADDSTLTLSATWPDPHVAYDLVTHVQANFQEARYDNDVAIINDSIQVLEDRAKTSLQRVDEELEAYQKVVVDRVAAEKALRAAEKAANAKPGNVTIFAVPGRPRSTSGSSGAATPDPEIADALEEKRKRIRELETERQNALDPLKQQLREAQLTLTPMHPTVIALQQRVDALSQPSPELEQLKNEEKGLMALIVPPPPPSASTRVLALPLPPVAGLDEVDAGSDAGVNDVVVPPSSMEDGVVKLARSKLEAAIRAYQDVQTRIDGARVELDVTSTTYKHRYVVVSPAAVPRKPKKQVGKTVAIGSVLGGLLLAILLATGLDLLSGRVLESWQVRRRLKLDVLAEFDGPG